MIAQSSRLMVRVSAIDRASRALRRLWFKVWCIAVGYRLVRAPIGVLDICDYTKSVTTS